jgi:hypothetical protein
MILPPDALVALVAQSVPPTVAYPPRMPLVLSVVVVIPLVAVCAPACAVGSVKSTVPPTTLRVTEPGEKTVPAPPLELTTTLEAPGLAMMPPVPLSVTAPLIVPVPPMAPAETPRALDALVDPLIRRMPALTVVAPAYGDRTVAQKALALGFTIASQGDGSAFIKSSMRRIIWLGSWRLGSTCQTKTGRCAAAPNSLCAQPCSSAETFPSPAINQEGSPQRTQCYAEAEKEELHTK